MTTIASQLDAARDRLRQSAASPYLTIPEAAELARCHSRTIRRAINAGQLEAFRPYGKLLLLESDVREWVEQRPAIQAARPRRAVRGRVGPGSVHALRELERQAAR